MDTIIQLMNGEMDSQPTMQRDDRFVLLSWRNIRNNEDVMLDGRTMTLMAILAIGIPLLAIV
ncbi:MAG: hypothetical protein H6922_03535 [Pseudomonadaceae bacterium]|nr:hypothetical protein [Pseudomonadaceae bacterium]